jgi:hypothetical protein
MEKKLNDLSKKAEELRSILKEKEREQSVAMY